MGRAAPSLRAKCLAEFLGTFLLVLTVECNVTIGSPLFAGLSIGAALFVAVQAFGGISGANFNPAVSVALGCLRSMGSEGMDWPMVVAYSTVQLTGGIAAAFVGSLLCGKAVPLAVSPGFGLIAACICEFQYTFMLCFVVLNVAAAKKNKEEKGQYFAVAIGFCIIAGAYGAGTISGAAFNPAVAISLDVSSPGFGTSIIYAFVELLAGVAAAWLFKHVRPEDFGSERSSESLSEQLLCETIGSFLLVLTVASNVHAKSAAGPLSVAAALAAMIYALGDVSGGHFNPAVTCAVYFSGRSRGFREHRATLYVIVQVLGGCLAALLAMLTFQTRAACGPKQGFSLVEALSAEAVFTFALSYMVLAVTVSDSTKASHFFGLAIGFVVVAGGFAVSHVSGALLNPAAAIALAMSGSGAEYAFAYVATQLAAGMVGALAFRQTHRAEKLSDGPSLER